jgi:hypothetical protein
MARETSYEGMAKEKPSDKAEKNTEFPRYFY